jgi:hypothetical protein
MTEPTKATFTPVLQKMGLPTLNAVKHGGFSNLKILPGEDVEKFKELVKDLLDEFKPSGALENDCVLDIAKVVWRKHHLGTYRRADQARAKWAPYMVNHPNVETVMDIALKSRVIDQMQKRVDLLSDQNRLATEAKLPAAMELALSTTKELLEARGVAVDFEKCVEEGEIDLHLALLGEEITPDRLVRELEVLARLDAMIDRQVKRLMQLKAMKPMVGLGSAP